MPKKRKSWDRDQMISAILACREGRMGYQKSAKAHNIPQTTLERYVKMPGRPEDVVNSSLGRKVVLSKEMEAKLAEHCLDMEKHFFGITKKDVCRLAFSLCRANNVKSPFNTAKECAGKKWFSAFMARHKELSLRMPQGISYARIKSFTRENVNGFFDLFEPLMEKIQHNPARLFNCDETGLTIVQHKHPRIVGKKGKKQIGAITSAERGSLLTTVMCFSAAGQYVPPFIIFPRKNMKIELMNGTPPGCQYACHISGWIQQDIFVQWLRHFINYTKPSSEDPVVLILDGHYSHTRNLEVINVARENFVNIVCLPPHSTHRMQPLDVAFMSPFKTFYAQEITNWLRLHPGRVVTTYQIGELFGKAYVRAATMETAINGFKKTGMFPPDRNVFKDYEFAAEMNEARQGETVENEAANQDDVREKSVGERMQREEMDQDLRKEKTPEKQIFPNNIMPVPSASRDIFKRKSSKCGKAAVVTSTPYKNELETSIEKRNLPSTSGVKRKIGNSMPESKTGTKKLKLPKKKISAPKRKLKKSQNISWSSSSSDTGSEPEYHDSDDDVSEDFEEDAMCIFCQIPFSEDVRGEEWVKCQSCSKWAHVECAGSEGLQYICDLCTDF